MSDPKQTPDPPEDEAAAGTLVPLYGSPIVPGVQAFRRGDVILYTIRAEPKEVAELVARLDKEGVGEVVALISHPARRPEEQPPDERSEG